MARSGGKGNMSCDRRNEKGACLPINKTGQNLLCKRKTKEKEQHLSLLLQKGNTHLRFLRTFHRVCQPRSNLSATIHYSTGGCVGSTTGLDAVEKTKISCPSPESNTVPCSSSLCRSARTQVDIPLHYHDSF
jgi:hypothetical protein